MTIVCFRFFLFKSLRWRVLESGFSLYFQSLREAYACVASAVVFFFFFFSRFFFSFFFSSCYTAWPAYARVATVVLLLFYLFFSPSRSARCFLARRALQSFLVFCFPNAPARVTNFREPAGLAVILLGLPPLV